MAQNFVQDGITLQAPVAYGASGVTKIYTGTPIVLSAGGIAPGAAPATAATGIDGIAMNNCAYVPDANVYLTSTCVYRTEGVFTFKVKNATTFVLGATAYLDLVDNSTATVVDEQIGARTTVTNLAGCSATEPAIGTVVALGSIKGFSTTVGTDYVQVKIVTRANSNLAAHS
jgi:hypothetical protein